MTSSTVRSLDDLSESERSELFRKCVGRALYLQLALFIATFLTCIAIQFVVTFIGLFFVDQAAQLDTTIRVMQWISLVPWTLAVFWWYTRWPFEARFRSFSAVFTGPGTIQQPNNALQATSDEARG